MSNTIFREPLLHFLGLAALLFLANTLFSGDDREVIAVDLATQDYLVQQQQDLLLRPMTQQEKDEIVENFVVDEILVREARKRGFENSSRIRTLLIQNMRFFMASEIPEPTEEDLRAYFDANVERFTTQPSVTYDHVVFNDPDAVPPETLEQLRSGTDHEALGDGGMLQARLINVQESQIVGNFGRELAPEILAIEDQDWHGPYLSDNGAHFLRVSKRNPPVTPTFESAQNWLATEWLSSMNREIVDREMAGMRENYRIEIEPREQNAE